ncbi:MAG: imidazolonepropionase [Vicingaceae bacterium]
MLITNIKALLQTRAKNTLLRGKELGVLPTISNAWLKINEDKIVDYGEMHNCPKNESGEIIDAGGKFVMPSWCDSHSHLVFAASREEEFVMRLKGKTYQEIAQAGGGILNSAKKLQGTSADELYDSAWNRLVELIKMGTGALEIKSGYGLTLEAELKMLRVIKKLKANSPIPIKATFLGAHAFPNEFKENHQGYIDLLINELLPAIAEEDLANYIDAFCEKVAFSVAETEQIIEAGKKYGLKAKIHTNQFNCMGGIEASVKHDALSVDHLEVVNQEEIDCLANSNTIATLLPSAPFFLGDDYPPARKLIDAGVATALSTDYNPGSSPSGNMNFAIALACIKMKMTPEEAINAATMNSAFAMELENEVGSISKGKRANLIITKNIPSIGYIPYAFGNNHIEQVIINGKIYP